MPPYQYILLCVAYHKFRFIFKSQYICSSKRLTDAPVSTSIQILVSHNSMHSMQRHSVRNHDGWIHQRMVPGKCWS